MSVHACVCVCMCVCVCVCESTCVFVCEYVYAGVPMLGLSSCVFFAMCLMHLSTCSLCFVLTQKGGQCHIDSQIASVLYFRRNHMCPLSN